MVVFLIILAVLVVLVSVLLSISATFTITYNSKWKTTVKFLWIDKEIELTKVLSFILFPEKKAEETKSDLKNKSASKEKAVNEESTAEITETVSDKADDKENQSEEKPKEDKPKKENYIKEIWRKDGIVGIMSLVSNLFETASDAVLSLFRGFHIHSLYVKILVGGGDAAEIAQAYGRVCKYYYPLKGMVLNGMKVDNYDDWIAPDFIAPRNEYGFQFIGSLRVFAIL
ncbi:MAG: hypothetical protein K2K01_01605, partial [Eubacterium sp.]|nr:hypothetical protein [Eubacterium sp.]